MPPPGAGSGLAGARLPAWDGAGGTRGGFERWKILGRLLLCRLQAPVLCTSLQSHAGLIMSSSKRNVFTKCAASLNLIRPCVLNPPLQPCADARGGRCRAGRRGAERQSDPEPGGGSHRHATPCPSPRGPEAQAGPVVHPLSAATPGVVLVGG